MIRLIRICLFLIALGAVSPALAAVAVVQALQFGEFIVRNNDAMHTITINTDGSFNFSPGFVEIVSPQEGIYDISGLPPSMAIASIVVTQLQPLTGAGNIFNMNAFQTAFTGTDAFGVARVTLGATVETTGTGVPYSNQTYSGQLQLQINF